MIRHPDYPANGGKIDGGRRICQGLFTTCRLHQVQPDTHICIGPTGFKTNDISFTEQGCEVTCDASLAQAVRRQYHVCQSGMQRKGRHPDSVIADPTILIHRAKRSEQSSGVVKRTGGRRIEPAQSAGIIHTPDSKFQSQTGQISFQDLRPRSCGQGVMYTMGP